MSTDTLADTLAKPGKYLSFILGPAEYGLEISKVQEIVGVTEVIRVPRTPPGVRGVIELRGRTIPAIELRSRFQMPQVEDTGKTCVIVVQVTQGDLTVTMGVIVDEVSEVLSFARDQIESAPSCGSGMEGTESNTGMGKLGKKVVILLDADHVLRSDELEAVARIAR